MPEVDQITEDAQLLRRIAAADQTALAGLYDRHSAILYSVAVKILQDEKEAEDVLQEVFVQIWEKAATFDTTRGNALGWTATLARNKAIDRLRARQRRDRLMVHSQEEGQALEPLDATENPLFARDQLSLIRAVVGSLPLEQQTAIKLAFFEGLTHEEIAARLTTPLGTIKARIRRGMLHLRAELEGRV